MSINYQHLLNISDDYEFLLFGGWGVSSLEYTFLSQRPNYYPDWEPAEIDTYDLAQLEFREAQKKATQFILDDMQTGNTYTYAENYRVSFSDVANISFSEKVQSSLDPDDVGQITYLNANIEKDRWGFVANMPALSDIAGDVFIGLENANIDARLNLGGVAFWVLLHETAHAVAGLDDIGITFRLFAGAMYDDHKYTIMSYSDQDGTPDGFRETSITDHADGFQVMPYGLQLLDIAAVQEEFESRDYTTRDDDTVYAAGSLEHGFRGFAAQGIDKPFIYTVWDGKGTDAIDASGFNVAAQIDLRQGAFSSIGRYSASVSNTSSMAFDDGDAANGDEGNVSIAFYTVIENARGTAGEDSLIGNAWDNVLFGDDGADKIYGDGLSYDSNAGFHEVDEYRAWNQTDNLAPAVNDSGNDVLIGGNGDDTLFGGKGSDILHGGFRGAEITAERSGWDEAAQFTSLTDITYANDGHDTASYARLNQVQPGQPGYVTIDVQMTPTKGTVIKGASGSAGTDILYSIDWIVGTAGADVFRGANGITDRQHGAHLTYEGGKGSDRYIFDLATDRGVVTILDKDASGVDTIVLNDFPDTLGSISMSLASVYEYVLTPTWQELRYVDLVFSESDDLDELLRIRISEDDLNASLGVENIEIGDTTVRVKDLIGYLAAQGGSGVPYDEDTFIGMGTSWANPLFAFADESDAPGSPESAGGATPTVNPSTGAFTGMKVNPSIGGQYLHYAYAKEETHPWIVKSYSSSAGSMVVNFETYLKSAAFSGGISYDDVRFTVSGSPGDMSLTVWIDSISKQYTIDYFEAGKVINGIGVYGADMHTWMRNSPSITINNTGTGRYKGTYEDEEEGGTEFNLSPITAHYYFETLSFAGGTVIDMQNDVLTFTGTAGADYLDGMDARDDILKGMGGNDQLRGYGGNDTYVFGRDFSATSAQGDWIIETATGGIDTLKFTGGIAPEEVFSWTDNGGRLWLQLGTNPATNTLRANGAYSGTTGVTTYVERIEFDDATVWDLTGGLHLRNNDTGRSLFGTTYADVIEGGAGADYLYGYDGADTLIGHGGNDQLQGGDGNDTYAFGRDFSSNSANGDWIIETATGGTDTIRFTGEIAPEEVYSWTDNGGRLWLQLGTNPATNTIRANGAYSSTTGITTYVERVEFDDSTVWDTSAGLHLRNTDTARNLYGTAYADVIEGGAAADNLYGYGGNDTLIGHGGNDTLRGGDGNDTYVFARDFSATSAQGDLIVETATGGIDTLKFTGSIAPEEVYRWTDNSGNLWLQLGTDPAFNTVRAGGAYSSSTGITTYVERVEFDDTTVWDVSAGLHLRNNDTARTFYGTGYADLLEGGSAVDAIYGYGGDDVLLGYGGNDSLRGGDGNDRLTGGAGNDALYGGAGADTFVYHAADVGNGIDTLYDFSLTDNDVLDLRDVLSGYDPLVDALADFVQFTNSGSNSQVKVDLDGAGTVYGWTQIATINGHINLDPDVLATNGHLLAA